MSSSEEHDHSSSGSENEHDQDHPKWDPSAKPKKGILRKDGEHHEKKEGHIALKADEDKDAEKKPSKKLPVEGISGVVVKGKGSGIVKKKDPNDKSHQLIQRKPLDPAKAAALSASSKPVSTSPRSEEPASEKSHDESSSKKKDKKDKKDKN